MLLVVLPFAEVARTMEKCDNMNRFVLNLVDETKIEEKHFADIRLIPLRHDASAFAQFGQGLRNAVGFLENSIGRLGGIASP